MSEQKRMPGTETGEITFFDLWQILVARKWIVLSAPGIVLLLGVLYLMQATEIYECTARVLVSQAGDRGPVENPAVTVQKIAEKYNVYEKVSKRILPRVSAVVYDKKDTNSIVLVTVVDATPKGAKIFLDQLMAEILAKQLTLFKQEMELELTRLKTLSDRLGTLEDFQLELEKRIASVERVDPTQAAILAIEKGGFLKLASELEKERHALQMVMSAVTFYPAQLLSVTRVPEKPIKPRRNLVLLLSGIFGLLFGVVSAFFTEFILNIRHARKNSM